MVTMTQPSSALALLLERFLAMIERRGISRSDLQRDWSLIPNWICYVRILLSPVPMIMLLLNSNHDPVMYWWTLGVFLFLATTDGVDGFIARTFNQTSKWGKLIDPVADKLLVAFVLIGLVWAFWGHSYGIILCVTVWFIFAREFLITAKIRQMYTGVAKPTMLGKSKTVLQMGMIALWLVPLQMLQLTFLPAVMGLTIVVTLAAWDEYYRLYVLQPLRHPKTFAM